MRQQHPDDQGALTDQERSQFRQIWRTLADDEDLGAPRLGWSAVLIACVVVVLIGLAANSGILVIVAASGGLWAHLARRRLRAADTDVPN